MSRLKAIPLELKEAQSFIDENHRHHKASYRDKFRVGCVKDGELVGVVQVGRPVSRYLDDGETLEVLRLCCINEKDVCSFLYSRASRIAKEMGYKKIITYILDTERGTSLKASGWVKEADGVGGKDWNVPSRPREVISQQLSLFEQKDKYPINAPKQRWSKKLGE